MWRPLMLRILFRLTALGMIVAVVPPLAAKQKKPAGKISDGSAFLSVQSYCIDSSGLEDYESYDVKGFIDKESQPGKLLSKISWKLKKDCSEGDSDVLVKLEFPRSRVNRLGSGPPTTPGNPGIDGQPPSVAVGGQEPLYHTVALLRVVSRQNSGTIYSCRADPLAPEGSDSGPVAAADTIQRRNALYGAFWTLAQDIQRVKP